MCKFGRLLSRLSAAVWKRYQKLASVYFENRSPMKCYTNFSEVFRAIAPRHSNNLVTIDAVPEGGTMPAMWSTPGVAKRPYNERVQVSPSVWCLRVCEGNDAAVEPDRPVSNDVIPHPTMWELCSPLLGILGASSGWLVSRRRGNLNCVPSGKWTISQFHAFGRVAYFRC